MKANTNIHTTEVITHSITGFDGNENAAAGAGNIQEMQAGAAGQGQGKGKPESELRAAARRHGLTLKELAVKMGVNYGYLSSVASGRRPWTPMLRERAMAALGEVPGQGVVYRQGGLVKGESSYIRERARELGMSLKGLAGHVGVSSGYMTQVARGQRNMSPAVQARVEAALEGPARVEPAQRANRPGGLVQGESCYIRERAPDKGRYFIWNLTQLNVRPYSRAGLLRYKIAPGYPLPGPFNHSGVGRGPEVAGPIRSYNLVFTYPCQGAGPGAGPEPEGVGEAGGGELRVPVGRGPGPQVHEPGGPGAGGGIAGGTGQGRVCPHPRR